MWSPLFVILNDCSIVKANDFVKQKDLKSIMKRKVAVLPSQKKRAAL